MSVNRKHTGAAMSRIKVFFRKINPISVLIWLAVLAVLLLVLWIAGMDPRKESETVAEVPPVLVRTMQVQAHTVRETVLLPGRAAANVSARLAAEKAGRVTMLAAEKGDAVKAGQVLMKLDDRNWQALERQAGIELADAERDLERWTQMKESGAVAASEYDAVRRRRDLAEAAAEQAAVQVAQCTVLSPFDGVVDARFVETGEYVNEGQSVFTVLDLTPLKVQFNIPERDAGAVRTGDRMRILSPALDGVGFEGVVRFIAQEASPQNFTYAAELAVEDPPEGLRPGMMVDAEIQRPQREGAIAVPLAAVIPRRGENIVFVVQDGAAVRRVVILEAVAGQEALISAGLNPGEWLVVEGQRTLQDGVRVQAQGQAQGQE